MVKIGRLKQIREMMKTKKSLSQEVVEGQALNGLVKVTVDGTQAMSKVDIDSSLLSADNKSKIEEAIKDAQKDALKQLEQRMVEKGKSVELHLRDLHG